MRGFVRVWLGIVCASVLALFASAGHAARPGGGESFSDNHSSSGGSSGESHESSSHESESSRHDSSTTSGVRSGAGGGGGGFALVMALISTAVVGLGVVIGVNNFRRRRRNELAAWTAAAAPSATGPSTVDPERAFAAIRARDPEFSRIVFEDLAYSLFAEVHAARGRHTLDRLAAYVEASVRDKLADSSRRLTAVRTPVIGAMRYAAVGAEPTPQPRDLVTLVFEASYTEVSAEEEAPYFVVEQWVFARSQTARSLPPDDERITKCPGCGAPRGEDTGTSCAYCKREVGTGAFDWMVVDFSRLQHTRTGPQLEGYAPETGTSRKTILQPDAAQRWEQLAAADPQLSWPAFEARVSLVFAEMQAGWSARRWQRVRPYLSDALFHMQAYWIGAYRQAHLKNVLENTRITRIEACKLVRDAHYDAITVRVFATGLDYKVRDDGTFVSGERQRERPYSEYWTLIRGRGVTGAPRTDGRCPACGGPLSINMAGACEHCQAKVTSGRFDWVLSRIEQDDVYSG